MGKIRIDLLSGRLEERLKEKAPELGLKRILSVERSTGGLSSENYWVKAETSAGAVKWVLRMEPLGGVVEPYDVAHEYRVIKALKGSEVPVPEVYYLEENPEVMGGRCFLMEFIEGEQFVHTDPMFEDERLRDQVARKFVGLLAKLQKIPPPDALRRAPKGQGYAVTEAIRFKEHLRDIELLPHPATRYAIDKLIELAPEDGPQVIIHGDFRLANFLWQDFELVGVLDWEFARLGDPLSDIGFSLIEGLHSWCGIRGKYADLYAELTGFEIDEARLNYFRVLEQVKVSLVGLSAPSVLARGKNWDLRNFSVAISGMGTEIVNIDLLHRLLDFGA